MASELVPPKGPIVGYALYGHDNRTYFFDDDPPSGVLCVGCKSIIDHSFRPAYLPLRTGMDISSTYDNVPVASERLEQLCRERAIPGVTFHRFEGRNKPYYFVEANRVVAFDSERRRTRFEDKCTKCGNFESVVGATPAYLKTSSPLKRGVFRTDLEFGSNQGKRPMLLIDIETAALFKSLNLLGMDLHPAHGSPDAI